MNETVFEQACRLMNIIANSASYCNEKEIIATFEDIKNHQPFNTIAFWSNVFHLSDNEKYLLGFRKFSEKDIKMNIPLWIWKCLPDNIVINGRYLKKDLDNDDRFGCVWWKA